MTVTWPLPQRALAEFRGGNIQQALAIADGVLADDPASADALLTRAMVRLTQGAFKDALPDLRVAADLRSGDWLLERLRIEFSARKGLALPLEDAQKLGGFIRSRLSPLGPIITGERRSAPGNRVNVVGSSYTRSFGGNSCFLPILVGMGSDLLFLNEDVAAISRRRMIEAIGRLDRGLPTILTLGHDSHYHTKNLLKTRKTVGAPFGRGDYALMEKVAERHRPLLNEAQKIVSGRLFLLCAPPGDDDRTNALSRRLNKQLAAICREMRVEFLDWWSDLIDSSTGRLAGRYGGKEFSGANNFAVAATGLFIRNLKSMGVLDGTVSPTANHEWTHVFECDTGAGSPTRIWCEQDVTPRNAVNSHKVAASHIYGKLADFMTAMFVATGSQSALYVNVRDGYLPTVLPSSLVSRSIALTASQSDAVAARSVLGFWGRSDVKLEVMSEIPAGAIADFDASLIIGATYPDSVAADLLAINAVLKLRRPARLLALLLLDPTDAARVALDAYSPVARVTLGHSLVPRAWQQATLLVFQGAG
jgi:hypothetical protein